MNIPHPPPPQIKCLAVIIFYYYFRNHLKSFKRILKNLHNRNGGREKHQPYPLSTPSYLSQQYRKPHHKKVPDAMGVKNADLNLAYIVFLPAALLYKTPPRHIWSFSVQRKKKHFGREREVFLLYLSTSFGFQNQTPIPSF